jgi:hypothetical protein
VRFDTDQGDIEMRYMLMHYSTDEMEAGLPPSPETLAELGTFMAETAQSGVFLAGEGVRPSSMGARLLNEDGKMRVIDGPFAEAKELIAGFAILDVKSRDEAVEYAKRFAKIAGVAQIDIRLVAEYSDFE